jgi:hypothetical protein
LFLRRPSDVRYRQRLGIKITGFTPALPNPLISLLPAPRPIARVRDQIVRARPGWTLHWAPIGTSAGLGQIAYHVYSNTGIGDPINYAAPIATVTGLSYQTGGLAYPGTWKFGVRAFWTGSGLEEQNLDCAVKIVLDSTGADITNVPLPPTGLRALATKGGGITVEWHYPQTTRGPKAPTGFRVYSGTGGPPSYASPVLTALFGSGFMNTYQSVIPSLADGTAYTIGVRAFNATGEEKNTTTVTVTADATGPSPVVSLTGTAIV